MVYDSEKALETVTSLKKCKAEICLLIQTSFRIMLLELWAECSSAASAASPQVSGNSSLDQQMHGGMCHP